MTTISNQVVNNTSGTAPAQKIHSSSNTNSSLDNSTGLSSLPRDIHEQIGLAIIKSNSRQSIRDLVNFSQVAKFSQQAARQVEQAHNLREEYTKASRREVGKEIETTIASLKENYRTPQAEQDFTYVTSELKKLSNQVLRESHVNLNLENESLDAGIQTHILNTQINRTLLHSLVDSKKLKTLDLRASASSCTFFWNYVRSAEKPKSATKFNFRWQSE